MSTHNICFVEKKNYQYFQIEKSVLSGVMFAYVEVLQLSTN